MQEQLALLSRHPVVTYALAAIMLVASGISVLSDGGEGSDSGETLDKARTFYEQNAEVTVNERNRRLLGPTFVDVVATAYEKEKDRGAGPVFSWRMQDRTQQRFERLADAAFATRMRDFPAWRQGVSGEGTPARNYLTHVFVHASLLALGVSLVFFIVAGIGLEMAWGSAVFAGFCLVGTLLPAFIYHFIDSAVGVPWAGASGLVSALLGAYWVRGYGGHLPLPGAALVPVFAFVELFFVRSIWIDNIGSAPFATLGSGLVIGVGIALAMRFFGIEGKLVDRVAEAQRSERDPALGIAERALETGNATAAWTALSSAHAESPEDQDVAVAFWNLACEQGRIEEAVGAIVPIMQDRLRKGAITQATHYWRVIVGSGCEVELSPAALVRLGEGLLDEGHPEIALDALGRALAHAKGLPTALAQRVVRVARDLDPGLTERAAAIALEDPQLDPATRETLETLVGEVRATSPREPARNAEPDPAARTTLRESTHYPIDSDIDVAPPAESTAPEPAAASCDEGIDPEGLSIASLERELAGYHALDEGEELTDPEGWNDPGLVADLTDDLDGDGPELFDANGLGRDHLDDAHIQADALAPDSLSREADSRSGIQSGSETAPLATLGDDPGRLGTGLAAHASLGAGLTGKSVAQPPRLPVLAPLDATPSATAEDDTPSITGAEATRVSQAPPAPVPIGSAAVTAQDAPRAEQAVESPADPVGSRPFGDIELETDLDIGGNRLRPLKLVVGVPVGAKPQALEVEIEGRGVSRVPFERIEAVAVAAVSGFSDKPVLVIDLVLNWLSDPEEPLKVVRFHSNRFQPTTLVPRATSAVDALRQWVAGILERSGATPLPSEAAVAGSPFTRYESSAAYEREVLGAEV